eukprot:GHVN01029517.1.p1 GENE.GHVN01029517.1~~GHVN01029517.1.p1  ORF type:complete len:274 (-),score=53.23 GHVN01029517.1:1125-1886(-)
MTQMREECPLVCWSSNSKYALFVFELIDEHDCEVDVRCAGLNEPEVKRLEWATRRELMNPFWTMQNMHRFALEMLQQLTSCKIMAHLEQLFDTVRHLDDEKTVNTEGLGDKTPEEIADHFDLVTAIRATLITALPHQTAIPPHVRDPTFMQLQRAVSSIPQTDMRKLKLRFHSDRLRRVLGRAPSPKEEYMATAVMQVLNGLVDNDLRCEKIIMDSLNQINSHRSRMVSKGGETSPENMKHVQELLTSLKVSP